MRRWLRTTHGPAGAGGRIRGGRVRPHPLLPHLVRLVHRVQRKVHEQGSLEGRLDAFGRRRLRGVPVQGAVRFRDEHAEIVCHTRTATMALAGRRGGVNQPPSTWPWLATRRRGRGECGHVHSGAHRCRCRPAGIPAPRWRPRGAGRGAAPGRCAGSSPWRRSSSRRRSRSRGSGAGRGSCGGRGATCRCGSGWIREGF